MCLSKSVNINYSIPYVPESQRNSQILLISCLSGSLCWYRSQHICSLSEKIAWYSVSYLLLSCVFLHYEEGWTNCQDLCLYYFTCYYQFYQFSTEERHSSLSGSLFHYLYYVFLSLLRNNSTCVGVECLVTAYKIPAESALLLLQKHCIIFIIVPSPFR